MKRKIIRDAVLLLVVFAVIWGVLAILIPDRTSDNGWISKDQEEKVAVHLVEIIESQFTVLEENPWQEGLDSMVQILQSKIPESKQPEYRVKVLDNSSINAFATLGGHIYFFTGLLEIAETPEEICAVLAHEMGHIEKDHVIKKLISEFGISIILGIATGGDTLLIREILKTLSSGVFSRKQEKEADEFALKTLNDAGISPRYLGIIFKRLQETQPEDLPDLTIISSHPSIKSRVRMSFEYPLDDFEEVCYEIPWPGMDYGADSEEENLNETLEQ